MKEFGWETLEVKDGHSVMEVYSALNQTKKQTKPQFIIFNTNKGNKVPKLENLPLSHVIPIDKNYMKEIFKDE
jgi:transketolase